MAFQEVAVIMILLVSGVRSVDYNYGIYVGDTFEANCGNGTHKMMEIIYKGDAMTVFAPQRPGCYFTEVEPAEFEIHNAMTNDLCYPDKVDGMEIYSLEVIIQLGNVHQYDDPYYLVTCSYELEASGSTSLTADPSGAGSERTPLVVHAVNATAQSTFSIEVHDVHDKQITWIRIGNFMQLVVRMTPAGEEVSFRVVKCFAFSNSTGTYSEYNFLVDGCGDGDVIKKDRGFLTLNVTDSDGSIVREAKSVFFRAFSLRGNTDLAFECEYVISKDNSADGASCALAPAAAGNPAGRRRKRRKRSAYLFETSTILNMQAIMTEWIKLLPRLLNEEGVLTYSLRKEGDDGREETALSLPNETKEQIGGDPQSRLTALLVSYLNGLQQGMSETTQAREHTMEHMLQQPLVICLIIACVLFFTTPLTVIVIVHQFARRGLSEPGRETTCYKRKPYKRFPYVRSQATPMEVLLE